MTTRVASIFPSWQKRREIISIHCSIRSTWSAASGCGDGRANEKPSSFRVQFPLLCSRLEKDIRTTHNSTSFAFILGLTSFSVENLSFYFRFCHRQRRTYWRHAEGRFIFFVECVKRHFGVGSIAFADRNRHKRVSFGSMRIGMRRVDCLPLNGNPELRDKQMRCKIFLGGAKSALGNDKAIEA